MWETEKSIEDLLANVQYAFLELCSFHFEKRIDEIGSIQMFFVDCCFSKYRTYVQ